MPKTVVQLQKALKRADVPRGTGYYIRSKEDVYVCWRDNSCVCLMSNEFPGHCDGTVKRQGRDQFGVSQPLDIPLPSPIRHYNQFMGGVVSDQLISYHRVLRQTKRYWRTIFYHLLEIAVTNAFIIHKWIQMEAGKKITTSGSFRDAIVLDIIKTFGTIASHGSIADDFTVRHGSTAISSERKKCVICHSNCGRQCLDCPFSPTLCQSRRKDCHGIWHSALYTVTRGQWFARKSRQSKKLDRQRKRAGRPRGSKNKKRKRVT